MSIGQSSTPGLPGLALKAWCLITPATGAIVKGFNVASVTRAGPGSYTVTFTNAMATTTYVGELTGNSPGGLDGEICAQLNTQAVGSTNVVTQAMASNGTIATLDLGACHLAFYE